MDHLDLNRKRLDSSTFYTSKNTFTHQGNQNPVALHPPPKNRPKTLTFNNYTFQNSLSSILEPKPHYFLFFLLINNKEKREIPAISTALVVWPRSEVLLVKLLTLSLSFSILQHLYHSSELFMFPSPSQDYHVLLWLLVVVVQDLDALTLLGCAKMPHVIIISLITLAHAFYAMSMHFVLLNPCMNHQPNTS